MMFSITGLLLLFVTTLTIGRKIPEDGPPVGYVPSSPNRTVILIHKETIPGQDLFLRGGIDREHRPGCTDVAETDACAIGIRIHLLGTIETYGRYNAWRVGDVHLDWYGAEQGQGFYEGLTPQGTPTAWTTNNVLSPSYQELNTFGDHYWMVDMEMDCSESESGMFEVKAFLTNDEIGWEPDISQGECSGDVGGSPVYESKNHFAKCGFVNVFDFGNPDCVINSFPY
ncbi:alpha-amylase-like [Palaemon carinicauda]|uniref:alpha-amylase-like n=1 Tax=Palaemon carinicauda TaxID=392227 RepID=UPI0035B687A3